MSKKPRVQANPEPDASAILRSSNTDQNEESPVASPEKECDTKPDGGRPEPGPAPLRFGVLEMSGGKYLIVRGGDDLDKILAQARQDLANKHCIAFPTGVEVHPA